jgi:guanosine-3',5'-bis(diphosphate) 3'-pyrophosphohydrolase
MYEYLENDRYVTELSTKLNLLDTGGNLDFKQINKALYWAKKYHAGQFRKSGEPFYTHPLAVAYIISDYLLKTDVIAASILHDIVEDTEVTTEMIEDAFGSRIAKMVDRLTRDRPDGTKLSVEDILNNAYINNDQEVILIKLMDRVHNLRTVGFKSKEKIAKTVKCSLNNFSSICLLFDDISIEKIFADCFTEEGYTIYLNPYVSSSHILSQALKNA